MSSTFSEIQVDPRFVGVQQLVGVQGFEKLQRASVCVVGLGGVGSWVVEALVRTGIGNLTLIDLDEVCITNINRQIQALTQTVGKSKAQVLAARSLEINPNLKISVREKFYTPETKEQVLEGEFDVIVDCIDQLTSKTSLIAHCVSEGIPIVCTGSARQRMDPTKVSVCDLSKTKYDPLLFLVRKRLRRWHGFSRDRKKFFNVPCVYAPLEPTQVKGSCENGESECNPLDKQGRRTCNDGLGTAVFVTGVFGFCAAAEVVRQIAGK